MYIYACLILSLSLSHSHSHSLTLSFSFSFFHTFSSFLLSSGRSGNQADDGRGTTPTSVFDSLVPAIVDCMVGQGFEEERKKNERTKKKRKL